MADNSKLMAAVCFFLNIIGFVIAILAFKDDKYVMYYAKQGLVLGVAVFIIQMILMITIVGILLLPIVYLATLILVVMGLLNAMSGTQKALPVIGGFAEKF